MRDRTELLRPYLVCPNDGERIALPHPNLEGTPTSQTEWPPDKWKRNFLCRRCGHVYAYSAQDVRWESFPAQGPGPQPKNPEVSCFEIPCAKEGCAARLRIHIVGDNWLNNPMLVAQLARQDFHDVVCAFGHGSRPRNVTTMEPRLDPNWWTED
jgi:hypothetical protein